MKRLFFFGYAPAGKKAWPLAGLGEELEPLDPRHGVFTNLVTTPILSALCCLPADRGQQVLADMGANVLSAGAGERRRLNVLTATVGNGTVEIQEPVKRLLRWPPATTTAGETDHQVDPASAWRPEGDVGLVFNFWPMTALFSFLIQGREQWTKDPLEEFGKDLLRAVMQGVPGLLPRPKGLKGLLRTLPDSDLARLGLYFRLCTHPEWDKVAATLMPFIRERRRRWQEQLPEATRDPQISEGELTWVLSVMWSMVPLPHTEIYDRYHPQNNPIGKWQDCFMSCQDPGDLPQDGGRPLFWQYVGRAVAAKLLG